MLPANGNFGPQLWAAICRSAAAAFAAALPRCAEVMADVRPPAHACFQFFGLDFLLDEQRRQAVGLLG